MDAVLLEVDGTSIVPFIRCLMENGADPLAVPPPTARSESGAPYPEGESPLSFLLNFYYPDAIIELSRGVNGRAISINETKVRMGD